MRLYLCVWKERKGKETKGNGWGVSLHVVTSVYVFFVWHETRVRVLSNIDSKLCGFYFKF